MKSDICIGLDNSHKGLQFQQQAFTRFKHRSDFRITPNLLVDHSQKYSSAQFNKISSSYLVRKNQEETLKSENTLA